MKIKVLYVEDEPALGQIVKESLESRDFEVFMIKDGAEATDAFLSFKPDVCVLDIMLPNKDGYTIAKEIRHHNEFVPIIFLTAKTRTDDLVKGFDVGGNDYLKKPFSMEELIVRINNLMSLSRINRSSDEITIGSFVFNPGKYELRHENGIKKLSYREATLLKALSEKDGPVYRKDILTELWGDDSFFNSRNLDVYVTKLREYLKEDDSVEIVTLRGVGYHLVRS